MCWVSPLRQVGDAKFLQQHDAVQKLNLQVSEARPRDRCMRLAC
jgi:hypothetical protein